MKKVEFEEIKERYEREKERLEKISVGDLVWETVERGGFEMDYHPAVVKEVNVDEAYVDVIDVTRNNKEMRYKFFVTESEMLQSGFSEEDIKKEYKEYSKTIEEILKK